MSPAIGDVIRTGHHTLRRHWLIACVLAVTCAMQLPAACNLRGFVATGQDYNPIHWGELYLHDDMPAGDDSEAGENARTMVFGSLYTWLPLALKPLGLPFESIVLVHALAGLPLLLLGLYALSYALFQDPKVAALSALIFPVGQFALFMTNVGYPLLYGRAFYYGDFNHVFVALTLAAMVRSRHLLATTSMAVLLMLNPTYGGNVMMVWVVWLHLSGQWRVIIRDHRGALAVAALGLMTGYLQTRLAMPIQVPATPEARRLAIETYGHIDGHIYDIGQFALAQLVILVALAGSCLREYRQSRSSPASASLSVAAAVAAVYAIVGVVGYYLLYPSQPELFIAMSPGKAAMVAAIWVSAYVGMGLYELISAWRWQRLVPLVVGLGAFLLIETRYPLWGFWGAAAGLSMAAAMLPFPSAAQGTASQWRNAPTLAVVLLVVDLGRHTAWLQNPRFFEAPNAFVDIQLRAREIAPSDTQVLPYRVTGSSNPYGMFTNFPFRTYSRRGSVAWVIGRNAYFNSMERQQGEERVFRAATGASLWGPLLSDAARQRQEVPLQYYFGLDTDGPEVFGTAGAWSLYSSYVGRMIADIGAMDLAEFRQFAKRAGATHVLICKDPGQPLPIDAIISNDYFSLVPVDDTSPP